MYSVTKIWHPERFQGNLKKKAYFEGWYFKLVDKGMGHIYAVIPGISFSSDGKSSHAFIQVLDGISAVSRYFTYAASDFCYSRKGFEIAVGQSIFSDKGIYLEIEDGSTEIVSSIDFNDIVSWPKRLFSPGAMGWYSFVPFMECYHGVISMDHSLSGVLEVDGTKMDFSGGRGYIEKDWGTSFPQGWIWAQSNNFGNERISLMLSIAKIPWRKRSFTGFICGFLLGDDLHIFSTYNGSIINRIGLEGDDAFVTLSRKGLLLDIWTESAKRAVLASPKQGAMDGRISESMDSKISVKLSDAGRVIFKGKSSASGLEIINPEAII